MAYYIVTKIKDTFICVGIVGLLVITGTGSDEEAAIYAMKCNAPTWTKWKKEIEDDRG